MPGCFPVPDRESRPLWASLSDWQHRSGLLQTRAAATSHCVNDVETVLRRGDRPCAWRWARLVASHRHHFHAPRWRSQAPENAPARHGPYRGQCFPIHQVLFLLPVHKQSLWYYRLRRIDYEILWLLPQRTTIGRHRGDRPDRLFKLLHKDLVRHRGDIRNTIALGKLKRVLILTRCGVARQVQRQVVFLFQVGNLFDVFDSRDNSPHPWARPL